MNEPEDALKGVLEHPRDDASRQAYASLLDARNDPLGEFIRLDSRLADPPSDGDEALRLWDRRLALLEAHGGSWLAPIAGIAATPFFRLGLVEELALDLDAYLEHGADLFGRYPIRSLSISGAHGRVGELLATPWLDRVESLSLPASNDTEDDSLGDDEVAELAASGRFRKLRGIDLGWNRRLGPRSVASILASPWCDRLESLGLGWTAAGDEGASLVASADRLDGLRRLNLSNSGIGPAGARSLAGSPTLARLGLAEFNFSLNHDVEQEGYARLLRSPALARVSAVDLDGHLDDELVDAILRSDSLGSMKALTFGNSWDIESAPVRRLARWRGLAQLDSLVFVLSGLADEQLGILAASPWLADLRSLRLSETKVTDDGVERLCHSPAWRGLRELGIDRNPLTERSVRAVLAATWFPQLTTLDFHASYGIGNAGTAVLASYRGRTRLRRLVLSMAGLGDLGALALAKAPFAPQLWTLWLLGNGISPSLCELLRKHLGGRVHIEDTDVLESWRNQPSLLG